MKEVIATAKKRIRQFANVNGFKLNPEMLEMLCEGIMEYLHKRGYQEGDNWGHISREEILEDLGDSEAYTMEVDEATGKPVIIYDEDKMLRLDMEDQIQIIIHEYLHHADVGKVIFVDDYLEAEVELISWLITLYPDRTFNEGLQELNRKLNPAAMAEEPNQNFWQAMIWQIHNLTSETVRRRMES